MSLPRSSDSVAKAIGCLLILTALGLGLAARSLLTPRQSFATWKGYRVLLVDEGIPEDSVLASLKKSGLASVLSESTQPVLVSNWARLERLSLAQARRTIASQDPRNDAYLQRMALWFEAKVGGAGYRAYYIKDEASPFAPSIDKAVAEALKEHEGKYLLPQSKDRKPVRGESGAYFGFAALLLLAAAAASPLMGRASIRELGKKRIGRLGLERISLRLALLLPWFALASDGLSAAALAVLWGIAIAESADSLDLPLDELKRSGARAAFDSLRLQPRPSWVLPSVALLALFASPPSLAEEGMAVGLALAGSLAAASAFVLLSRRREPRRRFTPLTIGGAEARGRGRSPADRARAILACSAVMAWGLCRLVASGGLSGAPANLGSLSPGPVLSYPSPVSEPGSDAPSPAEARARAAAESGSILPGISSYLEHRAIQEALPLLPVGEARGDPFAPLSMPESGDTSLELRFDEAWAKQAYAELPSLSIEKMLLEQGGATVGRAQDGVSGAGRPLAPIECLLYIFLLVPPIGRFFVGNPSRGAASGEIRQEA